MDKYEVILDLPAALVEIFFNLEKINNIYYIKQLMSFGIFLTSSFFFFKILNNRFKKFFLSLTGMLLFVTSPRIFGDSFFYKDVLFLSFFVIALYFFLKLTNKISKTDLIFFSLFCAISFNLRFFAIFLPICFLIFLIIESINNKKIFNNLKIFFIFFLIIFFFYSITITLFMDKYFCKFIGHI